MDRDSSERVIARVPDWLEPVAVANKVRVGQAGDGGYVLTSDTILATNALIGLGIASDWTFEEDFHSRKHKHFPVVCYDDRVTPWRFLEHSISGLFAYVLPSRASKRFRLPEFPKYVRFFVRHRSVSLHKAFIGVGENELGITAILAGLKANEDIFLKIDIEGSEYDVLSQMIEHRKILSGVAIEFHSCAEKLRSIERFVDETRDVFCLTHIHANNMGGLGASGCPNIMEMTFEKRATVKRASEDFTYPSDAVDFPTSANLPDYALEFVSNP